MGKNITVGGKQKSICVCNGDFTEKKEPIDVFVCSAYKRKYGVYPGTVFETLYNKMNISVEEEAERAELDYRESGDFWISRDLGHSIKRIACIELLDISCRNDSEEGNLKFLCKGFLNNLDKETNRNPDVFISYSSKQRERADVIRDMLIKHGVECWMENRFLK